MSTLTTVGLGIAAASPATAADTSNLHAVQARADLLSHKADAADRRHEAVRTRLTGSRDQLRWLTAQIAREKRVMDSLRAQVANSVVGQYDGSGSRAAPAPALSSTSKVLLTSVASVSENIGTRGAALEQANTQLLQLDKRYAAVVLQVTNLAGQEQSLRAQQQRADATAASAAATLAGLQRKAAAERMARLGGPVVAYAKSQVGKSYVFGAAGPSSFDCSGLTMMAWSQAGVNLPHNAAAQYASGQHISESELQPGDLVFYYSPIHHVGIYIGNGQIVNALNPGTGVTISSLHEMPYSGAVRPG